MKSVEIHLGMLERAAYSFSDLGGRRKQLGRLWHGHLGYVDKQ